MKCIFLLALSAESVGAPSASYHAFSIRAARSSKTAFVREEDVRTMPSWGLGSLSGRKEAGWERLRRWTTHDAVWAVRMM